MAPTDEQLLQLVLKQCIGNWTVETASDVADKLRLHYGSANGREGRHAADRVIELCNSDLIET